MIVGYLQPEEPRRFIQPESGDTAASPTIFAEYITLLQK